jgi:hypothetical protein
MIVAAVIKRPPKRAHDAQREQAQRLGKAYACWHPQRGEIKKRSRERDHGLLGIHTHERKRCHER